MSSQDTFLKRWAETDAKLARVRPAMGGHELEVRRFELKEPNVSTQILEAEFVVVASDSMRAGTVCEVAWFVAGTPRWVGDDRSDVIQEAQRFIAALIGAENLDQAKQGGAFLIANAAIQPARGMRVRCNVGPKTDKTGKAKTGKDGSVISAYRWTSVEQTPEEIASRRAAMESATTTAQAPVAVAPPPPPPAPVAAPATSFLAGLKL